RWSNKMEDAVPLYGFYPLRAMGAESIVKHRDLYWMTAPLNETTDSELKKNKKGVVVLASPDGLNWQKVDTILFDNPENILLDYAFFWLPPKLIKNGDNTMPFLYSVWKSNATEDMYNFIMTLDINKTPDAKITLTSFLNDDKKEPKFTRYNLKSGKYKFMEEKATRAFLADNAEYGYTFLNTIPGKTPEGTKDYPIYYFIPGKIPLPFKTFQNLDNLEHAGLTGNELKTKTEELKNRYAVIEYCYCGNQNEEQCKKFDTGNCPPYKDFIQTGEKGNDVGNWKIIDIVEDEFYDQHVDVCKGGQKDVPDYMCNIPFEHGKYFPKGQRSIPIWNWWKQIAADYPTWNKDSAKVFLRFSHWHNLEFIWDNYPEINKQLMENNKLIPFDCDGSGSSEITATCQDPTSWRTSNQLTLKFRPFSDFMIDPRIDLNFASLPQIRLEYLYPYPVMISDYGKPGDPAPRTWDMFVADHFAKEFFKVGTFEYGDSVTQNLMSGAAMTAVIKNGTMQIYAWGGENQNSIKRNIVPEQLLYTGTFNAETETVYFEQAALATTEGANSPVLTAGSSMVYDDEKEEIYLIGAADQNGISRIYRLDDDARTGLKTWRNVTRIDLGGYFRLVKKSEREYFAFGGQKPDGTFNTKVFLINLDDIFNPKQITTIPENGLANSFAAYNEKNGKLYIFGGLDSNGSSGRFLSFDTRTAAWNTITAAGGPGAGYGGVILVDYITETISLGGGVFENPEDNRFKWIFDEKKQSWTKELKNFKESFCISETDNSIFPGITNVYGECVKVENYDFDEVTFPDYKLSVAGYQNSLYLGGLTGIRRIEIGENGEFTKKEMIYSGESNNLAVYGNMLYAANYGEIDIFEIAEDGSIERKSSVKTNDCKNIRINNSKLFAAENKRVRIFDLNDPIAPKLLKTISLSSAAEDLEVAGNKLFVYENLNGLLTRKGKVSVFDISDLENTQKVSDFSQYCNDPEMQKSQDNVYLGCKNGVFKIEENGLKSVSGSKNYLREGYVFDGILYQVFGGTLHESKIESEETEEDGWF
ncbi:hypothetical protein J6Z19_03170, partial [bacterium]|nr:hypothetical protein [bacterium]